MTDDVVRSSEGRSPEQRCGQLPVEFEAAQTRPRRSYSKRLSRFCLEGSSGPMLRDSNSRGPWERPEQPSVPTRGTDDEPADGQANSLPPAEATAQWLSAPDPENLRLEVCQHF
jgi:hypothetical protein